jgi:hypothetical protein
MRAYFPIKLPIMFDVKHEYDYIYNNVDRKADPSRAYSSEDYLKITEEQLKAAAAQLQEQTPPPKEDKSEQQSQPPG